MRDLLSAVVQRLPVLFAHSPVVFKPAPQVRAVLRFPLLLGAVPPAQEDRRIPAIPTDRMEVMGPMVQEIPTVLTDRMVQATAMVPMALHHLWHPVSVVSVNSVEAR